MRIKIRAVIPALALAAFTALPSFAAPIVLGIAGDAQVGVNNINFGIYPQGPPFVPAPGFGVFETTFPVTDIFSANGVTTAEFGSIQSLNQTLEPAGVVLATPIQFMTFATGGSNLQLFLTELAQGNAVPGSPFVLTDTANGAVASFAADGYVLNTKDNSKTPYTGTFSATFNGTTVAQLLSNLPISTPFSATFSITTVNPVPEPASLLLMGVGLLGAGVVARKKVRTT